MGHHRTLSLVAEFLNTNCPSFGQALESVDLFAWFRMSEQASNSADQNAVIKAANDKHFETLPKFRYSTRKRRYTIQFESKLLSAEEVNRTSRGTACESDCEIIERFLEECKPCLLIMSDKLVHRHAEFSAAQFRQWLDTKTKDIRDNPPSIVALSKSAQTRLAKLNEGRFKF